jgi:hypothetical protein
MEEGSRLARGRKRQKGAFAGRLAPSNRDGAIASESGCSRTAALYDKTRRGAYAPAGPATASTFLRQKL